MEKLWRILIHLFLVIQFIVLCNCLPIFSELNEYEGGNNNEWEWSAVLFSVTFALCAIVFIIGCLCCQTRQKGFQEFTNASVTASEGSLVGTRNDIEQGNDPGLINPIAAITSGSEFTIFRPLSPSHHNNNVITTAPQTSIVQTQFGAKRITEANVQPNDDVNEWFDESEVNFPRNKLKYIKELGRGWFGRVFIGEAAILNDQTNLQPDENIKTVPVVVRTLDAAAGSRERVEFLRDARIYYKTSHPNIMPLHGKCLDVPPLLLIQPYYGKGDLKRYLREHENQITDKIFLLRLCWELTNALEYLYHRNISHPDLALRNCVLTDQMCLCLGDYGHSPQVYPEDYYSGTPPVPVRWCAPENVICTSTTIQPKMVTCSGNVWSLGIVLWEIISYGKQPYSSLSDDDVVTLVLEKMQTVLEEPQTLVSYSHNIYQLSRLCCSSIETRPLITQVQSMLSILLKNNDNLNTQTCEPVSDSEFLSRWNSLKPNTIVKTDNHTSEHNQLKIDVSHNQSSDKTNSSLSTTVAYDAKQLSPASTINSDCFIAEMTRREKSLSLTNLHGSLENLITPTSGDEQNISKNPFVDNKKINHSEEYESWLENIASQNKEDLSYVKGLSQAMQELDSALALEKSSSSSDTSHQPSPGPESWIDQQKVSQNTTMPKIDFKLGPMEAKPQINEILPNSQPDSLLDSILNPRSNSGSETEDETWKKRIERGAYSEKVRIKSKSVADLMVLTHIDTDTDSETPLPSLDYKTKQSFKAEILSKSYGSEGNINVVHDTFQEELRKLQEARRDSLLFVPVSQSIIHSESQNQNCDENIPSLNVINASVEDLTIKQDLDFPIHVFLQRKEIVEDNLVSSGEIGIKEIHNDFVNDEEDVIKNHDLIPRLNFIQASMEDLSNLDDLDIPINVFVHTSDKPVYFKFKDTSTDTDPEETIDYSTDSVLNQQSDESIRDNVIQRVTSDQPIGKKENLNKNIEFSEKIELNQEKKETVRNGNEIQKEDTLIDLEKTSNVVQISETPIDLKLTRENEISPKNLIQNSLEDLTHELINSNNSLDIDSEITKGTSESIESSNNNTVIISTQQNHEKTVSSTNSNTDIEERLDINSRKFEENILNSETFKENNYISSLERSNVNAKVDKICEENLLSKTETLVKSELEKIEEIAHSVLDKTESIMDKEKLQEKSEFNNSEPILNSDKIEISTKILELNKNESNAEIGTADSNKNSEIINSDLINDFQKDLVLGLEKETKIPLELNKTEPIDKNVLDLSSSFTNEIVTSTPFKPINQFTKPLENFDLSNETLMEVSEDKTHTEANIPQPTARNIFNKTNLIEDTAQKPSDISGFSLISDENTRDGNASDGTSSKQFLENEIHFVNKTEIKNDFDEFLNNIEKNINLDKIKENNPELIDKVTNFDSTFVKGNNLDETKILSSNFDETFIKTKDIGKTINKDEFLFKKLDDTFSKDIPRVETSNKEQFGKTENVLIKNTDQSMENETERFSNFEENLISKDIEECMKNDNTFIKGPDQNFVSEESVKNNTFIKELDQTFVKDYKNAEKCSDFAKNIDETGKNNNTFIKETDKTFTKDLQDVKGIGKDKVEPAKMDNLDLTFVKELTNTAEFPNETFTKELEQKNLQIFSEGSLEKQSLQDETKQIIPNSNNAAFNLSLDTKTTKSVDDLQSHTIDLAQTVTNLVDGLDCTIPNKPPEFNVMRFEIIPQYNFENSNVILGPCDDYTLDLYTGLKTTYVDDSPSGGVDDELLQFSTNFSSLNEEIRSNSNSDMFLSKVPPITPDLSSIITPCDSLEEHAMNTTFALKNQAENLVNNIIKDAEIIVCGKIEKYEFVPEVRNIVDEIIYKAECIVSEKQSNFDGSDTIETPQLDSLELNANSILDSSSSINKTVILKQNEFDNTLPNNNTTLTKFDSTYTLNEDVSGYSLELGWFLHPSNNEAGTELPPIEGTIEDLESPPTSDNSYVGFSLDEECVAALRNELAAKLPHAQGPTIEPDYQEDWECEPGTSEQHDEVILRYNVFAAPLSPIAEESEEFDCPTPETTPCREDSDSDCEWSGACFDGGDTDTRTPRAGSPNAAGRRSSRHRHTPSMDSCCSNDTLFNIEDLTGVPCDPENQKYNLDCDTLKNSPENLHPDECENDTHSVTSESDEKLCDTTQEMSKTIILVDSQDEPRIQQENTEAYDGSDVYPSSTERIEAEPSTQEINSDYFSPTRNDFLSQEQSCLETKSETNPVNSLKADKKIISEKFIENESKLVNETEENLNKINSSNNFQKNIELVNDDNSQQMVEITENKEKSPNNCLENFEKPHETYTMSDILQHLDDTPPVTNNSPPKFPEPISSTSTTNNFLNLNFDFQEELPEPKFKVKSLKTIASETLESNHFLDNTFLDSQKGMSIIEQVHDLVDTCQKNDIHGGMGNSEIFYVNINETIPSETLNKITNHFFENKTNDTSYVNLNNENVKMEEEEVQYNQEFSTNNKIYANIKDNSENDTTMYANVDEVCNFYANLNPKSIEPEKKSKHHNSFDDDSVLKFYENIPTSPVHDDKIIESLYENIDKVNNGANMEKLFASQQINNKSLNIYENTQKFIENDDKSLPTYHKLYENIEKSKDFPYQNKMDVMHNDSVENSHSENGHHDSDHTYDKVYDGESEDLYSDITDIRFSGPCDTQLMSTSFSDPHGGSDDQDWDSGSESRSSSSGEFVWKEGEHEASVRVLQAPNINDDEKMRTNEDNLGLSTPDDDSCSTSSGEDGDGVEFIPSAWDSQAAPIKSALRSPDKTMDKCERKRAVWFKKQKYHCVYEYPREPDFSPTEWNTQPYTSSIWGTPTASDLSNFADWELDTENMIEDGNGSLSSSSQDLDVEDDTSRYTRRDYFRRPGDLYRLADVVPDIDFATGLSVTDDDFYVTSSSKPFQSYSSQFFPGQLQFTTSTTQDDKIQAANVERANSIIEFANDLKKLHSTTLINEKKLNDLTTPDSGVEDITPASMSDHSPTETDTELAVTSTNKSQISSLKALAADSLKNSKKSDKVQYIVMGGLRHTRDKLKLDLPPSPTSFSANKAFNLEISSDTSTSSNSHREREPPTFTTFGKTRFSIKHVDTPTEELDMSLNKIMPMMVHITSSSTDSNNTDTNSPDAVDLSQPSDCDSAAESSMMLLETKRRSIEIVRGEASLLDSADEDSGIESSANATLERESVTTVCTDKNNDV